MALVYVARELLSKAGETFSPPTVMRSLQEVFALMQLGKKRCASLSISTVHTII